jgi:hypothetical protein
MTEISQATPAHDDSWSSPLSSDSDERPPDPQCNDPSSLSHASVLEHRLRLSINPKLVNKNEAKDDSLFKSGWENRELTPTELADTINKGIAYCCELSGTRRSDNFVASGVLSVDVDGTVPLDEMLRHPLVKRCLTIVYKTIRHTEAVNRYRLVFALPRAIESASEMAAASRSLALRLSGDPSATDAARISYGSRGSNPTVFDRGIDETLLADLIAQGLDADQRATIGGAGFSPTISKLRIAPDQVVRLACGRPVVFSTLGPRVSICCPFHADNNASAFTVLSKNKVPGLHCSACNQTFFSGSAPNSYDFSDFDTQVAAARKFFAQNEDMGAFHDLLFDDSCPRRKGLKQANITVTQTNFLKLPEKLLDGLILVKSPKGTGKTEEISRIVKAEGGTVLFISHRVSLIRQGCNRHGLDCYLDFDRDIASERVGICLDSLRRLRGNSARAKGFRTIILDESQQLLGHFLSDTIEPAIREQLFIDFTNLLRRAKRVVALDADLDWLTFETLTKIDGCGANGAKQCHLFINEWPSDAKIEVYTSYHHLVGELMNSLADGKRVFVTSNSKGLVERLTESVAHEFGEAVPTITITSETKDRPEVKTFILNPSEAALRYRAIFTSPSMGTGVDMTFPRRSKEIDVVFGFFESKINTHFDCDQQIARVRDPGSIKIWFNPRKLGFDTSREVIKHEIQVRNLYKNVLRGYDDDGKPIYHTDDPLIDMAALAVSQQRASKNNLRGNFIDLKRRQGCTVEFVTDDSGGDIITRGKEADGLGRGLAKSKRVELLLSAKTLTRDEYDDIEGRIQDNDDVSDVERLRLARTQIEKFYHEPVSEALINRDDGGRLRSRVVRFEALRDYASTKEMRSRMGHATSSQTAGLGNRFLRDRRLSGPLLDDLFGASPVYRDGKFDVRKRYSLHDLSGFMKKCRLLKSTIETAFDLEINAYEKVAVKQLRALLGLVGLRAIDDGKCKRGGKTIYLYRIDPESLHLIEEIVARRATGDGWTWLAQHYGHEITTSEE